MMRAILLPLLLMAAACDSDPAGPARGLRADAVVDDRAASDAPNVTLQLRNGGSRSVYLPPCGDDAMVTLERREEGRWTDHPLQVCPLMLSAPLELAPGEVAATEHRVDEPGRYRARYHARASADPRAPASAVTAEFTVD